LRVNMDTMPEEAYDRRSIYAPELILQGQSAEKAAEAETDDAAKRRLWEYLSVRDLLAKDFYPLIPPSRENTGWSVSQFHDYDHHRGVILAFRREESPFATAHVYPRDLELYAHYEVVDADTGKRFLISGKDVGESGMDLTIPAPRQSILLTYRALLPGMPY